MWQIKIHKNDMIKNLIAKFMYKLTVKFLKFIIKCTTITRALQVYIDAINVLLFRSIFKYKRTQLNIVTAATRETVPFNRQPLNNF